MYLRSHDATITRVLKTGKERSQEEVHFCHLPYPPKKFNEFSQFTTMGLNRNGGTRLPILPLAAPPLTCIISFNECKKVQCLHTIFVIFIKRKIIANLQQTNYHAMEYNKHGTKIAQRGKIKPVLRFTAALFFLFKLLYILRN